MIIRRMFQLAVTSVVGIALIASDFTAHGPQAQTDAEPIEYIVRIHTLVRADDGGIEEHISESLVSAQFFVSKNKWSATDMPVVVRYNSAGELSDFGLPAILLRNIEEWNAAGAADFSFLWGGLGTGNTGACSTGADRADGQNTVQFASLPGKTLGQTCLILRPVPGENRDLVEFDLQLDDDRDTWSSGLDTPPGTYDLVSAVLHELGHAAGLGHTCGEPGRPDCLESDKASVMYFSLPNGVQKRFLSADDIAGLRSAYGEPGTPGISPLGFRVRAIGVARE